MVQAKNSSSISVKVEVPVEAVGLVIGRQGANVKLIQASTNTKIKFSDKGLLYFYIFPHTCY